MRILVGQSRASPGPTRQLACDRVVQTGWGPRGVIIGAEQQSLSTLVLAGGSGQRFNGFPKAFLTAAGRTLLEHAVEQARQFGSEVIVGLPTDRVEEGRALVGDVATVIEGGLTREETIEVLVSATTADHVLIHDVARPLAGDALFRKVIDVGLETGAATAARPYVVRDAIGLSSDGILETGVDRDRVVSLQTPCLFRRDMLVTALERSAAEGWTDPGIATLVARAGFDVHLVETDEDNVKVTYPEDWDSVRAILEGVGQDTPDTII